MLKRTVLVVFIAMTAGTLSSAGQKSAIDRLEWIAGCWASDDGKERVEENWMKPSGQSMIGMSRTVAGGKTVFTEYVVAASRVKSPLSSSAAFESSQGAPSV